jgi:hypothetical protein
MEDIPLVASTNEGVSSLQYLEARLRDAREHSSLELTALKEMLFRFREDTNHSRQEVLEFINGQFRERDLRAQQRFEASEKALAAAMLAAEKAINAALTSAAQAVQKAEVASENRFAAVNEFRSQLADQTSTFIPRIEANAKLESISEKLDALSSRLDRSEGSGYGKNALWGYLIGAIGAVAAIVSYFR